MLNLHNAFCTKAREDVGFISKRMISSGNKLILCSVVPIVKPKMCWDLIFSANGSMTTLNRRGDKGHPCLVLLLLLKGLASMEEQKTWAEGCE